MNPRRRFTEDVEKEIVNKYINGTRSGELSKEYGCDRKMISNIAKRHGYGEYASTVKGGVRGINTEHLNEKIIALHAKNLSQVNIGKEVGISQSVVSKVLKINNLKPNNPKHSRKGEEAHGWKGGRVKHPSGYWLTTDNTFPEMTTKSGYVLEHRLNMAKYLKRPLLKNESVHHIDGNKLNNNILNLQLRLGKHGKGEVYKCCECGSHNITTAKI